MQIFDNMFVKFFLFCNTFLNIAIRFFVIDDLIYFTQLFSTYGYSVF